ncbi:MAG TPA: hypothetical protein PKZ59_08085 [Candidatus Hydrogenedentes bacterium]|nr:hypothetical protein [Candidatus Hydrogenedentota bacterium]
MRRFYGLLFFLLIPALLPATADAEDPNPATLHSSRGAWPLYRQWTPAETRHFAQWISTIYDRKVHGTKEQRLAKLEYVLTDPEMNLLLDPEFLGEPSNPQIDLPTIRALHHIVDCHKLLMSLGSYYACRRGLPFMYSTVRSSDGTDIRTAPSTLPAGTASSFEYSSAHQFFVDLVTGTCTGNLRVEPFARNSEWSDTCPVAITPQYLIPGCSFYLDGHVLVLAEIEEGGGVRFLDATTSPTRDLYTFNGMNAVTGITPKDSTRENNPYAGCFRGFRVLRYPIAETDRDGKVTRVRRRTDEEMREFGFSVEQYDRMEELVTKGFITEKNIPLTSMHQFIRFRMKAEKPVSPVEIIQRFLTDFAQALSRREEQVRLAWENVQTEGAIEFPGGTASRNIHHTGGRWGRYASALEDAELRGRYLEFLEEMDAAIQWFDNAPDMLDLTGLNLHAVWTPSDLALAALQKKNQLFAERSIQFTDSHGQPCTLTFLEVEKRLYDLSFNPNLPPEVRWGAAPDTLSPDLLQNCATPLASRKTIALADAYRMERPYRSLTRREIEDTPMSEVADGSHFFSEVLESYLWPKWRGSPSPPLVPHGGKASYERQLASRH